MKLSIVKYMVDKLKRALAIVQDGDTATRNIAKDKFVNWKGNIYTANQAIASGSTLSAASGGNLSGCDDGALNEIGNDIAEINSKLESYLVVNNPSSISDLETALNSFHSSMYDGDVRNIKLKISTALEPFSAADYLGTIRRISSGYAVISVQPHTGVGAFITGRRSSSSSWTWESLSDNLTQLSDQIAKITRIDCATLDSLKSQLISLAQSMAIGTCRNIMIVPSASFDVFTSGSGYSGYLWMTYNSNGQLYFSADVTNDYGASVYIGYRNGTWHINSLSSKVSALESVSTLGTGTITLNGSTFQTMPSDGYVVVVKGDNTNSVALGFNSWGNIVYLSVVSNTPNARGSLFVRKGSKIIKGGDDSSATATFYPLT